MQEHYLACMNEGHNSLPKVPIERVTQAPGMVGILICQHRSSHFVFKILYLMLWIESRITNTFEFLYIHMPLIQMLHSLVSEALIQLSSLAGNKTKEQG